MYEPTAAQNAELAQLTSPGSSDPSEPLPPDPVSAALPTFGVVGRDADARPTEAGVGRAPVPDNGCFAGAIDAAARTACCDPNAVRSATTASTEQPTRQQTDLAPRVLDDPVGCPPGIRDVPAMCSASRTTAQPSVLSPDLTHLGRDQNPAEVRGPRSQGQDKTVATTPQAADGRKRGWTFVVSLGATRAARQGRV